MKLSIGQKIFGIAAVVLALMIAVASYSIHLTGGISDDLDTVATRHLPLSDAVTRIEVRIFEQGVAMQRLFESGIDPDRFVDLGQEIVLEFAAAHKLLELEKKASPRLQNTARLMEDELAVLEDKYLAFEHHGKSLLGARFDDDTARIHALLADMDARQDALSVQIDSLRQRLESLTTAAVNRADSEEHKLLMVSSGLTILAALLALFFAAIVTRVIVRAVKNLVQGAKAVEAGELDTEVAVTSSDEIGMLTGAFNAMVGGLRLKERIKDTFGKYMDPRIVTKLLDDPKIAEPGGEKREMTVMFIDLKGFTSISEKLKPADLVNMINDFYTHMTGAIADNKGVVDKYIGDAVMAYWGPPFTTPEEHAVCACKAAIEALEHLQIFRDQVKRELGADADGLDIDLRIGVSSGEMIVGTLGSDVSRNFTVLGDPVNLGSRLEGASKAYGTRILISERTRTLVGGAMAVREIDLIRVKGKEEPTRVFELLAEKPDKAALPIPAADAFASGLQCYRKQQWDLAAESFRKCLSLSPGDPPSEVYLKRVAQLCENPPGPAWDGVWIFESK
ncbi:MAG: HAMP domain-containing protein [Rhodospirillaceae bacterium]|nr:HAMP domain-containing protein [Rhodospirillaceae bacterium]